jgi:hypothetical protein
VVMTTMMRMISPLLGKMMIASLPFFPVRRS